MQIVKIKNEKDIMQAEDTVLVLGYFDALHKGHRELFKQAQQVAKQEKLKIAALTFPESPQLAFSRFEPHLLNHITYPEKRYAKFAEYGLDYLYLIDFTSSFAKISSDDFISRYIQALRAKVIVVGFDYKFGHNKTDADYLQRNFDGRVIIVPEVQYQQQKISSTRLRQYISQGDVAQVNQLLGYEFSTRGIVVHTPDTRERLAARLGVRAFDTNTQAAAWADVVVLGVKPHAAGELLDQVSGQVGDRALVVSLCAGLSTSTLEAHLAPGARVVRVMPNTPAAVGAGMAGVSAGANATSDDLDTAVTLMSAVGKAVVVPESQQNALAALSGSGPALVFHAVEALVEAGVAQGLPRQLATELVVQTVKGSARLLEETGQHPSLAREAVTSPGGTTAAGLRVLDQRAVRAALVDAVDACVRRAAELG